jgi:hypothetical protein
MAIACHQLQWRPENALCWIKNSPDVIEIKDLIAFHRNPDGMTIAHSSPDVFSIH